MKAQVDTSVFIYPDGG